MRGPECETYPRNVSRRRNRLRRTRRPSFLVRRVLLDSRPARRSPRAACCTTRVRKRGRARSAWPTTSRPSTRFVPSRRWGCCSASGIDGGSISNGSKDERGTPSTHLPSNKNGLLLLRQTCGLGIFLPLDTLTSNVLHSAIVVVLPKFHSCKCSLLKFPSSRLFNKGGQTYGPRAGTGS